MEEEASPLKDKVVAVSDQYFKRARELVAFFFPNLDLGWIDMFQVVRDGQRMDDNNSSCFDPFFYNMPYVVISQLVYCFWMLFLFV